MQYVVLAVVRSKNKSLKNADLTLCLKVAFYELVGLSRQAEGC